jgi:branched-chain amino acid transport system permease protein
MDSRVKNANMTEPASAEESTAASTAVRAGTGTTLRSRWTSSRLLPGLAVMALFTLYFSTKASSANLFTFNSVLLACFGAIALNVLMGTTGQVSIGNSAFLAVGAFSTIFFLRLGLPFPADVLAAGLAAGVAGLIVGLPALRLRGLQLALATLAAFYIVYYIVNEYQSKAKNAGSGGFSINPLFQSKGLVGGQKYWAWLLFGLTSVLIILATRVTRFRSGREWRVIRDHETAAPALGIAVTRSKMTVFALSSVIIGLQGGLTVYLTGSVSADDFTLLLAVSYIAMVVIGGLDSIAGAVIGAAVVIALPTIVPHIVTSIMGAQQAAQKGASISEIVYGMLVVIFVTSSQRGIVGWFRRFRRVETSRQPSRRPAGLLGLLHRGRKGATNPAVQVGSGAPATGRKSLLTASYKD